MKGLKVKHALLIIALGFCLEFTGAVFRGLHQAIANPILVAAMLLKMIGAALLLYKIATYPKFKSFLNW